MVREAVADSPKYNAEILEIIGHVTTAKKLQFIIKDMMKSGMLIKHGDKQPYRYGIGRPSKRPGIAKTQDKTKKVHEAYTMAEVEDVKEKVAGVTGSHAYRIREALKLLPMRPIHVAYVTDVERRTATKSLSWMVEAGNVERLEDGRYKFMKDPKVAGKEVLRNMSISRRRMHEEASSYEGEAETIEEFLARGGVIERCATPFKFERLKHDEIIANNGRVTMGHQSPSSARYSKNW